MKKLTKDKRLEQMGKASRQGVYGNQVRKDSLIFKNIAGNSTETFFKIINDFYSKEIDQIFRPYPHALIEIILRLFLKNNERNPELTDYFTLIFQQNIDGIKNTCIKDKYISMLDAMHASNQSVKTDNPLIIWELTKNSFLAYNEFLNVLVGVILINYRFSIGKTYKLSTLENNYGNKVNELIELNPQIDAYKFLIELLKPEIRNAIGHQTIWFDKEDQLVTYLNDKTEENISISIKDFMFLNSKASYLGEAYLVAMSVIAIFSIGTIQDRFRLPRELIASFKDY